MKKRTFGRSGLEVSQLGFGGAPIGFLPVDRARVARMLNLLLDAGVNLIDTAAMYQGSEEMIGQAVGHRRKEFVLVTKCGTRVADIDAPEWSAKLIAGTVDRALKKLRTDVLDVMLLHSCDLQTLKQGDALGALVKAQKAGKIKWPGYSGDNEAAARVAARPEVAVIETSINIADQANIDSVMPIALKHNVGVLAKRPVANAAWKKLEDQPGMYKGYAKTYTERFRKMGLEATDLGFKGDADWPEIALRFTLSVEGMHSAIIGTTREENARANIAYAAKGPLPAETVGKIREAFKRAEQGAMEKWEGQT